jgi:uncharacterized protein involved in exopolysaccharide biosynthesis/Mrp family chromosome partitioning ATPase
MSSLPGPFVSISMEPVGPGDSPVGPSGSTGRSIPPDNGEQAIFRLDLRRSIQLHRKLVWAFALAGLVLGVAYYLLMWKVYLAQSVVYVQPAPPSVLQQYGGQRWPYDGNTYESYIAQQMLNVTRTDVLTAALHKLGHGWWWAANESEQAAVERLRRRIELTREGAAYQFSVGARAPNPDDAARIANAVAASFIESATSEQKAGDTQRLTVLGEERDRIQKELAADRAEQEALNKQLGQASIGSAAPDHYDEDIGRIRAELVKARSDHDDAAARYTSVGAAQGPSSASLDAEADELIATDAGLVSMKTALNARRAVLISQMANLTPSHPQYKQDAEELAKINASLDSMASDLRAKAAGRIQLKLRTDLERTAAVESQLNAQLGQLTGAAGNATSKLQRSSDLVVDIARLQARFAIIDEQWRNLMLEEGAPGSALMATPAIPPLHTAKSSVLRNSLAIVAFGLMLGLLAAVIAHKMDPKIYTGADVEQVLGFAPFAQLPDFDEVPDGVAEEHLLRLATAIEYARKQGDLKNCIFTSAGAGTGVTTVVRRVRALLEAMGRATVLVDASGSAAPAPHACADGQGELALATIRRPSRSSALVRQMAEESETQDGSLVLTDTAPLVVSAETEYLARHADCAIVVVGSGTTTRAQLREVAVTLQRLDVAAVGFVLNRIGLHKADPAFRLSVQAIEDHLNLQRSESNAARTARSQPLVVEEPIAGKQFAGNQTPNRRIPAKTAGSAPSQPAGSSQPAPPASVAQAPASPPPVPTEPLTIHEQLFVPTEPSPVPPRISKAPQPPIPVQPFPGPSPADPWWLEHVLQQPDAPEIKPLPPQSAGASEPIVAAPLESAAAPAPEVAIASELLHVVEPPPVIVTPQPMPAAPTPDPRPSPNLDWTPSPAQAVVPPVQVWEPAPEPVPAVDNRAVAERSQQADRAQDLSHVTSRFDGVRNVLTLSGLSKIDQTEVRQEPAPKPAPKFERIEKLSVFERAFVPEPEPVSASAASASPKVLAQPEFLPPQPIVYTPSVERRSENRAFDRPDRRSGDDEARVLPYKRGQYKRR